MKLTAKLLGFLNRVFDKDPDTFVALQIHNTTGTLTWAIADGVLTLTYGGADHAYDLSTYSLQTLATAISNLPGFQVLSLTNRSNLSAQVLLDGAGDQAKSNGDVLLGYSSILWAFVEAWAGELQTLRDAVDQMLLQLSTDTGSGDWLDELGSYYGVSRIVGESDAVYGQRIIGQTLRPISNNVAIEVAIEAFAGQPCTVDDVVIYGATTPLYDGSISYNGVHDYNAAAVPRYGLFDVTTAYDLILGGDIRTFSATVTAIVEKLRASGTHLRALALESATPIMDSFTGPTESTGTLVATLSLGSETLTAPTETLSGFSGAMVEIVETLTAPTESQTGTVTRYLLASDGSFVTDHTGALVEASSEPLFL